MKISKYFVILIFFVLNHYCIAQTSNTDILEIITTGKISCETKEGNNIEKRIQVKEKQTQEVLMYEADHNKINQSQLITPIKYKITILIDDNEDGIFENEATVKYQFQDGKMNDFIINDKNQSTDGVKKTILSGNRNTGNLYFLGMKALPLYVYLKDDDTLVVKCIF